MPNDKMKSRTASKAKRPMNANRVGAEGPKKSMKANPYGRTWRPTSKASEGPKKRMPRKKK